MTAKLTIGPILFHWPAEQKLDFYRNIAQEKAVDTVYIGETVCGKRTPFFEKYYDDVTDMLRDAGKTVVMSTLAEVMEPRDRALVGRTCKNTAIEIEANDASALFSLTGRPHRIGQLMNVYNEETMKILAEKGATHFCLPPEIPGEAISVLGETAAGLGAGLEVQVFGRMSLALSARCYHARVHGRVKANCLFVCEKDPDGMELKTLTGRPFLAVNGIQTLSYSYLNLLGEMEALGNAGVTHMRLSPHGRNMKEVIRIFDDVLHRRITAADGKMQMESLQIPAPFSNGFFYKKPGYQWREDEQNTAAAG